jgi:hypothetical protein
MQAQPDRRVDCRAEARRLVRVRPASRQPKMSASPFQRRNTTSCAVIVPDQRLLYRPPMRGDRVEILVDTGQGVQTFDIVASKNGRRLEVTTARGVVEVTEVTRGGTPVRTGRFMSSRIVALVEHPAKEGSDGRVDVSTRRRISPPETG